MTVFPSYVRHSREGGNPASNAFTCPKLDSRLRGNDVLSVVHKSDRIS
jgi:hypothetical protein